MNFNTQVCTTVEQSERLIGLGLKPETADMSWIKEESHYNLILNTDVVGEKVIPAWSLHRLMAICPVGITHKHHNHEMSFSSNMYGAFYEDDFHYPVEECECFDFKGSLYDGVIDCIEWLIKEEYLNKELLE